MRVLSSNVSLAIATEREGRKNQNVAKVPLKIAKGSIATLGMAAPHLFEIVCLCSVRLMAASPPEYIYASLMLGRLQSCIVTQTHCTAAT